MPPCASVRVSVRALRGGLSVSPAGWMPSPLRGVKTEACRLMTLSHHEGPQACSARKCTHETRTRRKTRGACSSHMRRTSLFFFMLPPHPSPSHLAGPKKHIGRTLEIAFLMSVTYVDQIHCNGMKSQKAIKSNKAKVEAAGGNMSSGCYLKLFTASRRLIGFFPFPTVTYSVNSFHSRIFFSFLITVTVLVEQVPEHHRGLLLPCTACTPFNGLLFFFVFFSV